jgi:hypothetical protein
MAEALTYTSLVSDIQNYAERSDDPFVAQIPRLIMLAENRIATEVKGLGYVRPVNFSTAIGDYIYEKPARWRETLSLSILTADGRKYLYPRTYEYCRMYWPNNDVTAEPEFYADYDYEHFLMVAAPDEVYPCELLYHERPEPLSEANQTNWTTRYAPQLMLYATLLEAQPFLKRAERLQEFQGLYDRAMAAIKQENTVRESDSSMRGKK